MYSEIGQGTRFKVYLPSSDVLEEEVVNDAELPNGHGELILVVDDEVTIYEITKTTLENHNYRVLTANDGIGALAIYAQHKDEISVVLIDLMMPGMDGPTTILTMQRMNSEAQIIAMSGLMSNGATMQHKNLSIQKFLPKPFTTQTLLKTLQQILHSSQT